MPAITSVDDQRYVKALSHPLRVRILGILEEQPASPVELSQVLDATLGTISYHVRQLNELGLLELVRETPRRGAIEHHYEATGSAARVPEVEWEKMPSIAKQAVVGAVLDETNRSVAEAAAVGGFDRNDAHITRTKLVLDDKGFKELSEALRKVLERADKIQEQSKKRLEASNHEGEHQAALALMLFETQPAVEKVPDGGRSSSKRTAGARA
jgi:DNA-binding transcriptional ArsR family regulator